MQPVLAALLPSPSGLGYLAVETNGDVIAEGDAVALGTPPAEPDCTYFVSRNPCPFSLYVGGQRPLPDRGIGL